MVVQGEGEFVALIITSPAKGKDYCLLQNSLLLIVLMKVAACFLVRSSCDSIVILVLLLKVGHRGRRRDGEGVGAGWANTFPSGEYSKFLTLGKYFVMSYLHPPPFYIYIFFLQYLKHTEKDRERIQVPPRIMNFNAS